MKPRGMTWLGIGLVLSMICACANREGPSPQVLLLPATTLTPTASQPSSAPSPELESPSQTGWTRRAITEDELAGLCLKDPQLTPEVAKRILARLNIRAHYYIAEDIRSGRPLKVPNDFNAYVVWTPLPQSVADFQRFPKCILVVKDLFYLGWYEHGQMKGNTMVCLGGSGQATESGVFGVLEKDADHYSKSYPNSFGQPAWMPWSLRIYEAVWIHAGDITGAFCSHGCVTLPLAEAETLFRWTDPGTPVVIVESLKEMRATLSRWAGNRS